MEEQVKLKLETYLELKRKADELDSLKEKVLKKGYDISEKLSYLIAESWRYCPQALLEIDAQATKLGYSFVYRGVDGMDASLGKGSLVIKLNNEKL